jgi:hypothetical protein
MMFPKKQEKEEHEIKPKSGTEREKREERQKG